MKILSLNFFYILILFSILGYGFLLHWYIFKKKNIQTISYGYIGLFGIFLLILVSYTTSLILPHTKIHNVIIIFLGLFFFYFFIKNFFFRKRVYYLLIIFLTLSIAFYISKTHDDFPQYHYLYTTQINNDKIQFGLPWFHYGFNHHSSLFYLHSLFFLPFIEKNLFNFGPLYILGFANIIFIDKIFSFKSKRLNFVFYINLLNLLFINIFFSRLSEHGTDRSASILILLIFSILIEFIHSQEKRLITILILLISLNITLKSFYIFYLLIFLLIFLFYRKKKELIFFYLKSKAIFFSILSIIYVVFFNFINNGCLLYPVAITCFERLSWAKTKEMVVAQMNWYEQWSKAGAGPNFRVDNQLDYIHGFNWVANWLEKYFFYKFSDYLLGLFLLLFIFYIFFYNKNKNINSDFKKNKIKFYLLFLFLILLIFLWFYKNPDLRYGGGYGIIALFFFIPLSFFLSRFDNFYNNKNKLITLLILLSFLIFCSRNINRIYQESKKYNYNLILNPYYQYQDNFDHTNDYIKKIIDNFNKCKLEKFLDCSNTGYIGVKYGGASIQIKELNGYIFFYRK
jgi:hypothetical protein